MSNTKIASGAEADVYRSKDGKNEFFFCYICLKIKERIKKKEIVSKKVWRVKIKVLLLHPHSERDSDENREKLIFRDGVDGAITPIKWADQARDEDEGVSTDINYRVQARRFESVILHSR